MILRAQRGGSEGIKAANDLLYHIAHEYRERKLHKFFAPGMPYADRDDIRQAFLIGCYAGIMKARLNIGDPLAFILNKGLWAVADVIRRDGQKELQQECSGCHATSKPNRVHGRYVCRRCESDQVELRRRVIPHAETIEVTGHNQDDRLTVQEFHDQLTGCKRDVFDLIMRGYDRDNCRNYLKEIGQILGISAANANLRLQQIREAWVQYQAPG
ncbi:hypothetical protein SD70_29360 [Gordoniibacillus kamchatkensis]|uniref:Sigma-70 family RNA polymerase sigma factor n=1 Tax=Gordoniibacillus kamchatkensis TaxID=1590651 RepID=A0ABR5AC97_9BACL|nr:hypothetical protein [Paenibacillus sp. VKM B-2647]KIL38007.1 hypothetical protein SD70_29360 [Paenibacillus sp. VKM B-2647]